MAGYRDIFTSFAPEGTNDKAVLAIISGNSPREFMESQKLRYKGCDGRSAVIEIIRVLIVSGIVSESKILDCSGYFR